MPDAVARSSARGVTGRLVLRAGINQSVRNYRRAQVHHGELAAPYADVIEIVPVACPDRDSSKVRTIWLRASASIKTVQPDLRPERAQLLRIGFKAAVKMAPRHLCAGHPRRRCGPQCDC